MKAISKDTDNEFSIVEIISPLQYVAYKYPRVTLEELHAHALSRTKSYKLAVQQAHDVLTERLGRKPQSGEWWDSPELAEVRKYHVRINSANIARAGESKTTLAELISNDRHPGEGIAQSVLEAVASLTHDELLRTVISQE